MSRSEYSKRNGVTERRLASGYVTAKTVPQARSLTELLLSSQQAWNGPIDLAGIFSPSAGSR